MFIRRRDDREVSFFFLSSSALWPSTSAFCRAGFVVVAQLEAAGEEGPAGDVRVDEDDDGGGGAGRPAREA